MRCLYFSQPCLQIWYGVIVLCPESQDRGSSTPLLAAWCNISSVFRVPPSPLALLPASQFLPVRGRALSPRVSIFLSLFSKKWERGIITPPAAAFGTLPEAERSATLQGHRAPLPHQVLRLFMRDAACLHIHVREVCCANTQSKYFDHYGFIN